MYKKFMCNGLKFKIRTNHITNNKSLSKIIDTIINGRKKLCLRFFFMKCEQLISAVVLEYFITTHKQNIPYYYSNLQVGERYLLILRTKVIIYIFSRANLNQNISIR